MNQPLETVSFIQLSGSFQALSGTLWPIPDSKNQGDGEAGSFIRKNICSGSEGWAATTRHPECWSQRACLSLAETVWENSLENEVFLCSKFWLNIYIIIPQYIYMCLSIYLSSLSPLYRTILLLYCTMKEPKLHWKQSDDISKGLLRRNRGIMLKFSLLWNNEANKVFQSRFYRMPSSLQLSFCL
jgi:hypothetical protein